MCGIVGELHSKKENIFDVERMLNTIAHRGPDAIHSWVDEHIALGHVRLSILDLGPRGAQPMHSASGRYVITYNGEIYNFPTLKKALSEHGYPFSGGSDTEVILAGFELWGCGKTLQMLDGMFALAVWDKIDKKLYLARDRFGEKPLYYYHQDDCFIFASELKALLAHPACKTAINDAAIPLFLRYSYIPTPQTIYTNIYKLPPAHLLYIHQGKQVLEPYWSATEVAERARKNPLELNDSQALQEFASLFKNTVSSRLIADVPVGAFFSGGIDSTAVVTTMSEVQPHLKTFTIGFTDAAYDETQYAKQIAKHLNTDHAELILTPRDVMDVIPSLASMYDEPFADASQIPTFLVSKFAARDLRVVLSGDGGDELFGGYNRHIYGEQLRNRLQYAPQFLRQWLAKGLGCIKPDSWRTLYTLAARLLPPQRQLAVFEEKIQKLSDLLRAPTEPGAFYNYITAISTNTSALLLAERFPVVNSEMDTTTSSSSLLLSQDFTHWMMLADTLNYLPDDILTKVDRAAMANSLETRAPFLSPDLFEFAWRLPLQQKIRQREGKWLLREFLKQQLPAHLVDRPKMGFSLPLAAWLRQELRDWAESLLSEMSLQQTSVFSVQAVRQLWQLHVSGRRNFSKILWNILMLQTWLLQHGN